MARIKSGAADRRYSEMRHALVFDGDKNFCTVVALAAICRIPVAEAKAAMAAQGRKDGCGASDLAMIKAAKALGFEMKQVPFAEYRAIIDSYPGAHKNLKTITTHHPVRFAKAWVGRPDYLMFSHGHVSAYVDGRVVDWTEGRAKQVYELYTVDKIGGAE